MENTKSIVRKLNNVILAVLSVLLLLLTTILQASDIAKEKRWAEQVEDSLLDGEVVYLKAGDSKEDNTFFTLYTKADDEKGKHSNTAILLMHGSGVHPDWPQIINPLRSQLPELGWSVLSIQLPIVANDAKPKAYEPLVGEAVPRIKASIDYLLKQGFKKIVIIAHSYGTEMASHYLANSVAHSVDSVAGYIGIGMPASNIPFLSKITIPVLDLHGSDDLPGILKSAEKRALASSENKKYQQKKVKDADHFFEDKDDELVKIVQEWLTDN